MRERPIIFSTPMVQAILNAKRGYSWESNPWVWVYEFIRQEK